MHHFIDDELLSHFSCISFFFNKIYIVPLLKKGSQTINKLFLLKYKDLSLVFHITKKEIMDKYCYFSIREDTPSM